MLRRKRKIIMVVGTVGASFAVGCMVLFLGMRDGINRPTAQRCLMISLILAVEEEVVVEVVVDEDAVPGEVAAAILRIPKTVLRRRLHRESVTIASFHLCPGNWHPKNLHQQTAPLQPTSFRYQRWKKLLRPVHLYRLQKVPGQTKLMLVRSYESIPLCLSLEKLRINK
jgi:hypothetical protein